MNTPDECPVCLDSGPNQPRARGEPRSAVVPKGGNFLVDCKVCGNFAIPEELWADVLDPQSSAGRKLSDVCRAHLSHRLVTGAADASSERRLLTSDYVTQFIEDGCPGPIPAEQATNIVRYVGDSVSKTGQLLNGFPDGFYAIIGAPNEQFVEQLVAELIDRGFLTGKVLEYAGAGADFMDIGLTLDGWERFEAEKRGKVAGNYGFIAMKFNDVDLDSFVRNVVIPAVKEGIGYDLVDMRDVARAGIIDNIMRAQIRDAAFVVVDLTHDNYGAYWEAGYAEGLGKPVIYICEEEKFKSDKTHFDTNHCTTVLWSSEAEELFRQELVATLRRSLNLFPSA